MKKQNSWSPQFENSTDLKIYLFNVFFLLLFRYSIDDLKTNKMFLLNLAVNLCLDSNQPCVYTLKLLENIMLPKPFCNLETKIKLDSKLISVINISVIELWILNTVFNNISVISWQ